MNEMRGMIMKTNQGYSVFNKSGDKVSISNLPLCIKELGMHEALLEVTYYINNSSFRTADLDEACKAEIKSTIGE